jgi:stress response protein SCP2
LVPNAVLNPYGRQAILRKEGMIRLKDYVAHCPSMIIFGLKWDVSTVNVPNQEERAIIDVDASAICLDQQYNLVDLITGQHSRSCCRSICHGGDEREGNVIGNDDELLVIYLPQSGLEHQIHNVHYQFSRWD